MKVLLFLTVVLAIAAVVLSSKDHDEGHHKQKGDRHHSEKKHHGDRHHSDRNHGERSHGVKKSRSHGSHGKHERAHEEEPEKSDRHIIIRPYCNIRQMKVCGGYDCPDLTCANYDTEVDNWAKCLFETNNSFTNLLFCGSYSSSKCICRFGLILDESSGRCLKKSECGSSTTLATKLPTTPVGITDDFATTIPPTADVGGTTVPVTGTPILV